MISVITTSYNYSEYISETIKSVLAQTYSDWELIIIDDCSTDNSLDIINSFDDERIKVYQNESNLGLKNSLKKGLELANGDWIAFLESDDLWDKECLEKRFKITEKFPDAGLIFNDVNLFGDKQKISIIEEVFSKNRNYLLKKSYPCNMFYDLNFQNRILTFSAVMVKKNLLETVSFETPLDKLLDWWLYIHLANECDFYYIDEKLTQWRIHRKSYIKSKDKKNKKRILVNIAAYIDVYKRTQEKGLLLFIVQTFIQTILLRISRIGLLGKKIKAKLFLPL